MQEWINSLLNLKELTYAALPASFMLGFLGSVTSCCNIAVLSALAGYSGTQVQENNRKSIFAIGLFFLLGSTVSLGIIGAVTGYASEAISTTTGNYWRIFAGMTIILFGLFSLKLVPVKIPSFKLSGIPTGKGKALLYGFVIGGGVTACTGCCNPAFFAALGMATMKGHTLWGAAIMCLFALGYALPLAGAVIGLSFGSLKLSMVAKKHSKAINSIAGVIMIFSGFYVLATI